MYISLSHRVWVLVLSFSYFSISYLAAATISSYSLSVPSYTNVIDGYQVFIDWMIIPYSSSMAIYFYVILATKHQEKLRVLLAKLTWAVFIACALFLIFPAKFSFDIPITTNPIFANMYALLHAMDSPYNQAPSLHVIFCVIFYSEIKSIINNKIGLLIARGWLVLVALSTWFTYQHHSVDILSGLIIGIAINCFVDKPQHYVGSIYLMISGLSFILATLIQDTSPLISAVCYYLWFSFTLVSIIYLINKPELLLKNQATFSLLAWLLYSPYLVAYRMLWSVNNHKIESRKAIDSLMTASEIKGSTIIITHVSGRLFVGARLSGSQLALLPEDCRFIDLSAEVAEVKGIKPAHYQLFPMLDLQPPCFDQIRMAVQTVHKTIENKQTVYLHCAMGYSRSFLVACVYLVAYKNYSVCDAKRFLLSLNGIIKLPESYVSDKDLERIARDCSKNIATHIDAGVLMGGKPSYE